MKKTDISIADHHAIQKWLGWDSLGVDISKRVLFQVYID